MKMMGYSYTLSQGHHLPVDGAMIGMRIQLRDLKTSYYAPDNE